MPLPRPAPHRRRWALRPGCFNDPE